MKRMAMVVLTLASMAAAAADMHQEFGWKDGRKIVVEADFSIARQPFSCTIRPRIEYLLAKNHKQQLTLDYTPDGECRLSAGTGRWSDHYAIVNLFDAESIEVDHIVPLREAWDAGASSWTRAERRKFATDHLNLSITSKEINNKKRDKQVYDLSWVPERFQSCDFAKRYASVKGEYSLTFTEKEIEFYLDIANRKGCPTIVVTSKMFGGYKVAKWVKVR
jgi:hypothetical protein